nr:glycosyltransferase [Nocardioides convexus]
MLLFAGRIQPLKAPDVLLRAVAEPAVPPPGSALPARRTRRRGAVRQRPGAPHRARPGWPPSLRIDDVVRFVPPVPQHELAGWYAAASLVAVPSYNESFGLVAAEAQATGAPVIAAAVGGLTTVVRDGHSGLLVDSHDATVWAAALEKVVLDADLRDRLAAGALVQAEQFTWEATAAQTLAVYERAHSLMREEAGALR